jgi:hypothetical protein
MWSVFLSRLKPRQKKEAAAMPGAHGKRGIPASTSLRRFAFATYGIGHPHPGNRTLSASTV